MKHFYFLAVVFLFFSGINAQNINFPDANFKAKLVGATFSNGVARNLQGSNFKIDVNSDGEIQESEAAQVSYLFVNNTGIVDFTGIKKFINLEVLDCHNNFMLTLDLSGMTSLKGLYCYNSFVNSINFTGLVNFQTLNCSNCGLNTLDLSMLPNLGSVNCSQCNLSYLNVSGLTNLGFLDCSTNLIPTLDVSSSNLTTLKCGGNQLTNLDVSHSTNLQTLECGSNNLTSLNLTGLTDIQVLWCTYNALTSLDVTPFTQLRELLCDNNPIPVLDTRNLTQLEKVSCFRTQITTLDVSNSPNILKVYCDQNPLMDSLFIKNGSFENSLEFGNNPLLRYICADDAQLTYVQSMITNDDSLVNCFVNSYCSFVPGGVYYTIQGAVKYDENNNGCDASDMNYSDLKMAITSGAATGALISSAAGDYLIPVAAGAHTVSPVLENPTYFTVSPTTVTKMFPVQSSPAIQDFCVTANGTHDDLEITLLPINHARPGTNSRYKILYKNKGTATQTGSLILYFNDGVSDFVTSNPAPETQIPNQLNWTFISLRPFETREIIVTLNLNSPVEIPPLTGGDVLNFTATIAGLVDETPNDNIAVLNQAVVNSFDPNDKTCLEGNTITPEMVGKEVHYLIRFENTGTANAENIVVKDMIDATKFDIASLIPIDGSHPFVTKISNTNKVEFIFENINLPFDDANNDGYVAFKIKTKPTLVLGDSFSNTASIYFDYNFPIITNDATTTVAVLANQDFAFEHYITIHPNPANAILNIDLKKNIAVTSFNIYNTLGQLVLVIPNAQQVKTIDVSSLKTGNYFLKVNSDKGSANMKFIKQ